MDMNESILIGFQLALFPLLSGREGISIQTGKGQVQDSIRNTEKEDGKGYPTHWETQNPSPRSNFLTFSLRNLASFYWNFNPKIIKSNVSDIWKVEHTSTNGLLSPSVSESDLRRSSLTTWGTQQEVEYGLCGLLRVRSVTSETKPMSDIPPKTSAKFMIN